MFDYSRIVVIIVIVVIVVIVIIVITWTPLDDGSQRPGHDDTTSDLSGSCQLFIIIIIIISIISIIIIIFIFIFIYNGISCLSERHTSMAPAQGSRAQIEECKRFTLWDVSLELKIHQRGVAVETGCSGSHYTTGCFIKWCYPHPLHPLRLHPPVMNTQKPTDMTIPTP